MNFYQKGAKDTKNSNPNEEVRSTIYEVRFKSQIVPRASSFVLLFVPLWLINIYL